MHVISFCSYTTKKLIIITVEACDWFLYSKRFDSMFSLELQK